MLSIIPEFGYAPGTMNLLPLKKNIFQPLLFEVICLSEGAGQPYFVHQHRVAKMDPPFLFVDDQHLRFSPSVANLAGHLFPARLGGFETAHRPWLLRCRFGPKAPVASCGLGLLVWMSRWKLGSMVRISGL